MISVPLLICVFAIHPDFYMTLVIIVHSTQKLQILSSLYFLREQTSLTECHDLSIKVWRMICWFQEKVGMDV